MCGRYSLHLSPSQVREYLQIDGYPVDDYPEDDGDDTPRQTYNFAPTYHGMVYRAETQRTTHEQDEAQTQEQTNTEKYKLQTMKWGLIPFWTKRTPDYGSQMKTINCRDDSLYEDRGMWTSMKKHKRCIVIADGFYEWLKKNGGKEKIPHYVKRKDGKPLYFAGLWDCVQYEGSEEKLYTYTIITTTSNKQLNFLHDRMPVIFENGSQDVQTWLDPNRSTWTTELQSLLKPYSEEIDCYPVSKDVGKVGNDSPNFVVPISSSANKQNIANFFANSKEKKLTKEPKPVKEAKGQLKLEHTKAFDAEEGTTAKNDSTGTDENNAPNKDVKKETLEDEGSPKKGLKREHSIESSPIAKASKLSPTTRKLRSSTSNQHDTSKKPVSTGNQRITQFFKQ